ncbi:arginase family protein [Candidatus Woesearchaeota archaeon]|nr:arginase family protein [Candidatus Woesearchaeota archaeon]
MKNILKISTSQGSLNKNIGSELAPSEIIKHIKKKFKLYSVLIDSLNMEITNLNIFNSATGFTGIIIGGDHSITYSAFKAMAEKCKNPGLIMLDAHVDCTSYIKPPSHEDFLRVLLEDSILKQKNTLLIGVRNVYNAEKSYIKTKKINIITMQNIINYKKFLPYFSKLDAVYLSIDIDVLDPKIASGTHYKVKGGMGKKTIFSILKDIKKLKNLKIVDIVEVNPKLDKANKTVKIAAELIDFFHHTKK